MSPSSSGSSLGPPPPECMQQDDYAAADRARLRLHSKKSFAQIFLPHLHRVDKSKTATRDVESRSSDHDLPAQAPELSQGYKLAGSHPVQLDDDLAPVLSDDEVVYRWAILYENQRGATIFSTSLYSPLSLFPWDPPPFTIPSASTSPRADQPTVSLAEYPLPDGTWRWVSRAWMIDMRSEGEVQYDGFEYGWSFRNDKWRSTVGFMSAGGFVRRRRWVRLMVRPSKHAKLPEAFASPVPRGAETPSRGATRPPSVVPTMDDDESGLEVEVWRGDEYDWERCHAVLRRVGRDGRKLEMWAQWLGLTPSNNLSEEIQDAPVDAGKQLPEEFLKPPDVVRDGPMTVLTGMGDSSAPRSFMTRLVRAHGSDILKSFIYPDSRAHPSEVEVGMGVADDVLDFWSYSSRLDGLDGGSSLAESSSRDEAEIAHAS
ncbi:hypothetical protein B0H21DRAFT_722994 [Amylocystis lapponica]|nr:hypothetical protein B0H21DRAFT_722994 [Amylocystis lapponica]